MVSHISWCWQTIHCVLLEFVLGHIRNVEKSAARLGYLRHEVIHIRPLQNGSVLYCDLVFAHKKVLIPLMKIHELSSLINVETLVVLSCVPLIQYLTLVSILVIVVFGVFTYDIISIN